MKKIDVHALTEKLKELILGVAVESIPGEAKLDKVIDQAAEWLDEHSKWGFLGPLAVIVEAADGPTYRKILRIPAQMAFDWLRSLGKV